MLDTAIHALCTVIESGSKGIWLVDSTSGVRPEDLRNLRSGDVIVKHPRTDVHMLQSQFDHSMIHEAVHAVSEYVLFKTKGNTDE